MTVHDTGRLPELSEERIDAIERAVFAGVGQQRSSARARRGWWWAGGTAAAGVIALAAVLAPSIGTVVPAGGGAASDTTAAPLVGGAGAAETGQDAGDASAGIAAEPATREIIASGSASVRVDDIAAAAEAIAAAAQRRGGFVESLSVGTTDAVPLDPSVDVLPVPVPVEGGWITVRVPSAELPAVIDELASVGAVESSSISRQDVTEQAIDLRARLASSEASVARLTELLAQAQSVADLIAAESALAERQATLESYRQQLQYLEGQVEMSSLTVSLLPAAEPVVADPAGFGDGVVAGWNGLVAALNGIVIGVGFLLPWLGVLAVLTVSAWLVVALIRRRRRSRASGTDAPVNTNR